MAAVILNGVVHDGAVYDGPKPLPVSITQVRRVRVSRAWNCLYIRPTSDSRFDLVCQRIVAIGDDFTFDEIVVTSADTPQALMAIPDDPDFVWPIALDRH